MSGIKCVFLGLFMLNCGASGIPASYPAIEILSAKVSENHDVLLTYRVSNPTKKSLCGIQYEPDYRNFGAVQDPLDLTLKVDIFMHHPDDHLDHSLFREETAGIISKGIRNWDEVLDKNPMIGGGGFLYSVYLIKIPSNFEATRQSIIHVMNDTMWSQFDMTKAYLTAEAELIECDDSIKAGWHTEQDWEALKASHPNVEFTLKENYSLARHLDY